MSTIRRGASPPCAILAMVDLGPIAATKPSAHDDAPRSRSMSVDDSGMGDPLNHDAERLRLLIERHHAHTGSARAATLLADWSMSLTKFVKIMPRDYRRALMDLAAENGSGGRHGRGMTSPTGFLDIERRDRGYEAREARLKSWREFVKPLPLLEVERQATRCMSCGIPFCHTGCPVNNLIPDWNDLVSRDQWREALETLHSTNNFPEFTGRVCPAPCEAACTLNLDDNPVTIKTIECQIVDRGWNEGWILPQRAKNQSGRRVAIVGSGPAGMACAQQLARVGPRRHGVREERPDRRPAALRHSRTSRWRSR